MLLAILVSLSMSNTFGGVITGMINNVEFETTLKVVPTLNAAQEELKTILHDGDTVLFLNDLPDIY